MLEAAWRGELKAPMFGEDLVQTEPDSSRTRVALQALEFLVVQEIFRSQTAELAHVVLPGASCLEKDGTFTNAERRIQRVRRVLSPPGGAREDWRILNGLMAVTGYPQIHDGTGEVMAEIARVVPAFAGVSHARLEGDGLQWPVTSAVPAGTSTLHVGTFPRGRAQLTLVEYVPSPGARAGLMLITGRVLEHYNAGTMTRRTGNVQLCSGDWLEIHPIDAAARAITDGAPVVVKGPHGEAFAHARLTECVAPGVVFLSFHFPETHANAATGDVRDRLADCPEYKLTSVDVSRRGGTA
ncbi:MAG: molybdopterin dinucleotide binding domain-containing protein [Planctomycetota bacterium]